MVYIPGQVNRATPSCQPSAEPSESSHTSSNDETLQKIASVRAELKDRPSSQVAKKDSPLWTSAHPIRKKVVPSTMQSPPLTTTSFTAPEKMPWKEKGDDYLAKGEFENALDCYTKELLIDEEQELKHEVASMPIGAFLNRAHVEAPFSLKSQTVQIFDQMGKPQWLTPVDQARTSSNNQVHHALSEPSHSDTSSTQTSFWITKGDDHFNRREYPEAIETYTEGLKKAEEENATPLIACYLKKMSMIFLEQRNYSLAAKALSGSFALLEKTVFYHQEAESLFQLMAELERKFLMNELNVAQEDLKDYPDPNQYVERKRMLFQLRERVSKQINLMEDADKILDDFSNGIGIFFQELTTNCIKILGPPPCTWAIIGLGSLARKEMSPFSDLEFAILIENEDPQVYDYFRRLTRLLELKVIYLGETEIKILDKGFSSPNPRGFSFDDGGNTPLGKAGYVELIGTPEKMAIFQNDKFYREDLILSNVLKSTSFLAGNKELHQSYEMHIQMVLNAQSANGGMLIREERALDMLKGHLAEFAPKLGQDKEETPLFNIKFELYRLPNMLINVLADYYGLTSKNTWQRIDGLYCQGVFSKKAAENLKQAMQSIMTLRMRCHLYYRTENDDVYHPSMKRKNAEIVAKNAQTFYLTSQDIQVIDEIYRVILPLHRNFLAISEAFNAQQTSKENTFIFKLGRIFKTSPQTDHFQKLSGEDFRDQSLASQGGYSDLVEHNYRKAQGIYEQAVALNPDDFQVAFKLSRVCYEQGHYREAKKHLKKALVVARLSKDKDSLFDVLDSLGDCYFKLAHYKLAIQYYSEVLEMGRRELGDSHPKVAFYLSNLGFVYRDLGHPEKALRCFESARRIALKAYGDDSFDRMFNNLGAEMASHYNNSAMVMRELGHIGKAKGYLQGACIIDEENERESHPAHAVHLGSMGLCYLDLGNPKKAKSCLEKALSIRASIYEMTHPDIASCLRSMGLVWDQLGMSMQALKCHEQALKIYKDIFISDHPEIAVCLGYIGKTWEDLRNPNKALEYYQESFRINKKIYGNHNPKVASDLNNLGSAWIALENFEKAFDYLEESIKIQASRGNARHPSMADSLKNLGSAFKGLDKLEEAVKCYNESLEIYTLFYGDKHPKVAEVWGLLGAIKMKQEEVKGAAEHYAKQLNILKTNQKAEPIGRAKAACELGRCYHFLGDEKRAVEYFMESFQSLGNCSSSSHNTSAAFCLFDMGKTLYTLGYNEKALSCFEGVFDVLKQACEEDYPYLAEMHNMVGQVHEKMNHPKKALKSYEEALRIGKKTTNDDHPDIGLYLNNLGSAYSSLGKTKEAIKCYEGALAIGRKNFGDTHPSIATRLFNLGMAWQKLGDYQKSVDYLQEAVKVDSAAYGENHPEIARDLNHLGEVFLKFGDLLQANQCFERALEIDRYNFDENHPNVIEDKKRILHIYKMVGKSKNSRCSVS